MRLAGLMGFMSILGMACSVACLSPRAMPLTWIRNHSYPRLVGVGSGTAGQVALTSPGEAGRDPVAR